MQFNVPVLHYGLVSRDKILYTKEIVDSIVDQYKTKHIQQGFNLSRKDDSVPLDHYSPSFTVKNLWVDDNRLMLMATIHSDDDLFQFKGISPQGFIQSDVVAGITLVTKFELDYFAQYIGDNT